MWKRSRLSQFSELQCVIVLYPWPPSSCEKWRGRMQGKKEIKKCWTKVYGVMLWRKENATELLDGIAVFYLFVMQCFVLLLWQGPRSSVSLGERLRERWCCGDFNLADLWSWLCCLVSRSCIISYKWQASEGGNIFVLFQPWFGMHNPLIFS